LELTTSSGTRHVTLSFQIVIFAQNMAQSAMLVRGLILCLVMLVKPTQDPSNIKIQHTQYFIDVITVATNVTPMESITPDTIVTIAMVLSLLDQTETT
jgi:hypothetical protein